MLFSIYAQAKLAFIGGGFDTGLHNTLEPASFGIPICFGPRYSKFVEAVNMVKRKCAFPISSSNDLKKVYSQLQDPAFEASTVREIKAYMNESKGATNHILKELQA